MVVPSIGEVHTVDGILITGIAMCDNDISSLVLEAVSMIVHSRVASQILQDTRENSPKGFETRCSHLKTIVLS